MSKNIITMIIAIAALAMGFTKPNANSELAFKNIINQIDSPALDTFLLDTLIAQDTITQTTSNLKYGSASFYHNKFVGRKTASGAIFSQEKLTCAHRKIPLGKTVRVTNLTNGKSVDLLVNDRMGRSPHAVDLSRAAAKELDFIQKGWVKVSIEVLD